MPVTQAHEAIALVSFLVETAERRGSGWLEVRQGGAPVGTVVFRDGQVAWASSAGQKEHLGHFLERIGYLSPEQLQETHARLRAGLLEAPTRPFVGIEAARRSAAALFPPVTN